MSSLSTTCAGRKYLSDAPPTTPPRVVGNPRPPWLIDPWTETTVDAWLSADPRPRATVVYERLVPPGFTSAYQREKLWVQVTPVPRTSPRSPGRAPSRS